MTTAVLSPASAAPAPTRKRRRVLPGFAPTLGFTLFYLSLLVLIPLCAVFLKSAGHGAEAFWAAATSPRVLASYRLSFGAALLAAAINVVFGFILAWSLVRYEFSGKRLVDALIDLPFALPTAVAGIALASLYAPNGWIGEHLMALGIKVAYTPLGILVALVFVGLPFVVRTVQPVIEDLGSDLEEAGRSLGASDFQILRRVIFPAIFPAFLAGCSLSFARSLGEFGAVIFIAGNQPMRTEIVALLTFIRLEEYNYQAAAAIAALMLVMAFVMLVITNAVQAWHLRYLARGED
jgi:sulfate transport system permease protein